MRAASSRSTSWLKCFAVIQQIPANNPAHSPERGAPAPQPRRKSWNVRQRRTSITTLDGFSCPSYVSTLCMHCLTCHIWREHSMIVSLCMRCLNSQVACPARDPIIQYSKGTPGSPATRKGGIQGNPCMRPDTHLQFHANQALDRACTALLASPDGNIRWYHLGIHLLVLPFLQN